MLAIQKAKGGFDERWIAYCDKRGIPFKIVDCYKNDIIFQLAGCSALLWQYYQGSEKDILMAKQLLFAVEHSGMKVFPDFKTAWHFDDKLAQKYLLEALQVPVPDSYVFFTEKEALEWIYQTNFPKVFKLRCGASSANVRLVRCRAQAKRLINKAFHGGFSQYNKIEGLKERIRRYKTGQSGFADIVKGLIRFIYPSKFVRIAGRESGYIYFQDFIQNNQFDIRVIVIDQKAFAIKRSVRRNDFRASGSGNIEYDKELFDLRLIELSLNMAVKLGSQCVAFDFVFDGNRPLVTEISYGFSPEGYDKCQGYWDEKLVWHEGSFDPYGWIIEMVLN